MIKKELKQQKKAIRAQQTLEEKNTFLDYISHEIRTPLHYIYNISQFLHENFDNMAPFERKEQIASIFDNSRYLKDLVNELLDLSKFNAGKMIFNFSEIDLQQLISNVMDRCQKLYLLNNSKLSIVFVSNNITKAMVLGDKIKIHQLIMNLLTNAIKYTNEGVITIILNSINYNGRPHWQCNIIDQGIGIPDSELELIFEPHVQGSRAAFTVGTGLAICKEIVNAHQGKIWAENNDNKGARITFTLPLMEEQKPNIYEHIKTGNKNQKIPKNTILVIDNEIICHDIINLILPKDRNYKIINAYSGKEALDLAKKFSKELRLIILDMLIPDMPGYEIYKITKNDKNFAHVPVLFQTALSPGLIEVMRQSIQVGTEPINIIYKPYKKEELINTIDKLIAGQIIPTT
jgi:nitrogen-specific signal transduction histidine kinase